MSRSLLRRRVLCVSAAALALLAQSASAGAPQPAAPEPAASAEAGPDPAGDVPPGVRSDRAGGLLRYRGEQWTIINTLHAYSWDRAHGWRRAGPVGEDKKRALRNAVEAFNRIPGLRLKLRYDETDDPAVVISRFRNHRDKFVVYWAEDADEGGLPRPFSWHAKYGYKGGTSVFVQDAGGEYVSEKAPEPLRGPIGIAGAAIFARERIKRASDLDRCKSDAPYYAFLHEVGHALGLGHATPGPSIMRGSCGLEYMPNDIQNLRRLYGL